MHQPKHPKEKSLFLFGVFLYAILLRIANVTCPIRSLLRIPCPGCGMTRALLCAVRLDFPAAFSFHPLFVLVPLLALYYLFDGRVFGRAIDVPLLLTTAVAFAAVWVLRVVGVLPVP